MVPAPARIRTGELVDGRFQIERLCAEGGMGDVYRALDLKTQRPVALKLLRTDAAAEAQRLAREAELLAGLDHPGVVKYVAHAAGGEQPWVAMDWLEGEDLSARLERGPLGIDETITIGRRIADALHAAHAVGVIHRDVKPSNVFLVDAAVERAVLIDFGIAKRATADDDRLTVTGTILGTPGYLAPEQARAQREVDARADVFALGAVLFKCLSGRMPFTGTSAMAVLAKILLERAPDVRDLRPDAPPELCDLIARMLSKSPNDRPATAAAIARALETIAATTATPMTMPPPSLGSREQRLWSILVAAPEVLRALGSPAARERRGHDGDEPAPSTRREGVGGEALARFGASIDQLADGSVMIALASRGNAAELAIRAARCALTVRTERPRGPMALATGIGLVERPGAVGSVIDRAAALLRAVSAHSTPHLIVDDVTARLLGPRFATEPAQPMLGASADGEARGAVLLVSERESPEPGRTFMGRASAFVGRDRELASLFAAYEECASEHAAGIIVVTGAAGVGKSRLRYELLGRLASASPAPQVWMARGDPMRAGSSFGMIAECIREAAAVRGGEPLETRRDKLAARIGRHLRAGDGIAAEFLCEIAGAPFADDRSAQLRAARRDAQLMHDQVRRAWEDLLAAECAAHPTVLVLEDLHWGDLPSVRLIDAAVARLADAPLLVLAFARPDVNQVFPRLWEERGALHISLGALGARASADLVRDTLGDSVPESDARHIVAQASGNALYLEELIRAAAEGKGRSVPTTILAMLHARLEELDADARRALRAASLFGQTFWRGGVAALLGESPATVAGWIDDLVDREVVQRRSSSKLGSDAEYVFRHALVCDTAYGMLTDADRALGHGIAGRWLEEAGERDPVVLAEHFERGAQPERAVTWYRHAAEEALSGNDLAACVARVAKAISCGATGETLGSLRRVEAEALGWQGDTAGAIDKARDAMRLLAPASPAWFSAATAAITMAGRAGDVVAVEKLVCELPEGDAEAAAASLQCTCLSMAAVQLFMAAKLDLGTAILERATALFSRLPEPREPSSRALLTRARAWREFFDGDIVQSFRTNTDAAAAFLEAGDVRNACRQMANAGAGDVMLGAYEDAERSLREALAGAERLGIGLMESLACSNLGIAVARSGRLAEAAALEERAIAIAQRAKLRRMEGFGRAYLAIVLAESGQLERAESEARAAAVLLEVSPISRPLALGVLSRVLLAQGRTPEALEAARDAMRTLESVQAVDEGEAIVRLAHAEALHASGDHDAARTAIQTARTRLLDRAAKLTDAAKRESFLQRVPENARTLELANAW